MSNKEVVYMTTKKMLSQETFKVMEENETIVQVRIAAEKILFIFHKFKTIYKKI